MDSLLVLLLVTAIAALSNWLQHRAQSKQEPPPNRPRPPQPMPGPRRPTARPRVPMPMPESALERELRRLLGEDQPAPPPVRPAVPAAPPPPPLVSAQPAVHPPALPVPVVVAAGTTLAKTFGQSAAGMQRAQQLHESVAQRLRQVDQQTEKHGGMLGPKSAQPLSADFAVIRDLRTNPAAARQAFVASLIFGAPKGLES